MRITSGKLRNRKLLTKLKSGKQPIFRPTSARTRLAIFNIIQSSPYLPDKYLDGAHILDIFCGSGSFGFEAISRGAGFIAFVDDSPEQLELAKLNAKHLGLENNVQTIRAKADNLPTARQQFKIVYLDPPYGKNLSNDCLKSVIKGGWLDRGNLIIVEHDKYEKLNVEAPLELLDTRVYGRTHLSFLTYKLP